MILEYDSDMSKMSDLRSDDRNSETSSVQAARATQRCRVGDLIAVAVGSKALLRGRQAVTDGGRDDASAAMRTIAGHHRNRNHGADEEDIKDDAEECEECLAAEEACQHDGEDGVKDCSSRQSGYCFKPCSNDKVAVGQDREEVSVNTQDDTSAAELDGIEDGLEQLESSTAESHLDE